MEAKDGTGRRNMTWEEAARELAKAARNALDEAGPGGPIPSGLAFAEACMMGISVLMRRTIHANRWKAKRAAKRVLGNPPFVTPGEVIEGIEGSEG